MAKTDGLVERREVEEKVEEAEEGDQDDDAWDPFADPAEEAARQAQKQISWPEEHWPAQPGVESAASQLAGVEDLEDLEAAFAAQMLESLPQSLWQQSAATRDEDALLLHTGSGVSAAGPPEERAEASVADARSLNVDSDYEGPIYTSGEISSEFLNHLMIWQMHQKTLAKRYAYGIVLDVIELLKDSPTVVDVEVPKTGEITVFGDIHGQYYDLLNVWYLNGLPSEDNPCLFNGDFVDRGSFSVEVILALFAWKLFLPRHVHLARGNHESRSMNHIYGFEGEVRAKYDVGLYSLFCEAFCCLPLCHVINRQVFVVHGGLFSREDVTLDELRRVNRTCEPLDEGLMVEMLWSDPHPGYGLLPSKRGVGVAFGQDVTENFLRNNDLRFMIRSHEMCEEGFSYEHGEKLITLFSAPNYCDQMGNKGAFIRLDGETMTPQPQSFTAAPHPPIGAMQYAFGSPFF